MEKKNELTLLFHVNLAHPETVNLLLLYFTIHTFFSRQVQRFKRSIAAIKFYSTKPYQKSRNNTQNKKGNFKKIEEKLLTYNGIPYK